MGSRFPTTEMFLSVILVQLILLTMTKGELFSKEREIRLLRGQLLTNLSSIQKEYNVSLEILFDNHTSHDLRNMLQLSANVDEGEVGFRILGLWFTSNNQ